MTTIGIQTQRCALKKEDTGSVKANMTIIAAQMPRKPILDPESTTDARHINDIASANHF